ncbi:MAG: universal stress protein [Bauldia sp.]
MTYRTILVHVDRGAPGRLLTAVDLARQHGAALIGLAAEATPIPRFDADLGSYPTPVPDAALAQIRDDFALCEGSFVDACRRAGIQHQWRSALDLPGDVVLAMARRADLVVVGPFSGDADNSPDPGELLMRIGRPLLVVPDGSTPRPFKRAIVAWKDTREARRAATDALPLLRNAENVRLIAIATTPSLQPTEDLLDVTAHLAAHGVASKAEMRDPGDSTPEQALVSLAATEADVIVAGGYGHSRLREWVLGGVTRALLDETGVAALLSH